VSILKTVPQSTYIETGRRPGRPSAKEKIVNTDKKTLKSSPLLVTLDQRHQRSIKVNVITAQPLFTVVEYMREKKKIKNERDREHVLEGGSDEVIHTSRGLFGSDRLEFYSRN
jgi:hypothetical protein